MNESDIKKRAEELVDKYVFYFGDTSKGVVSEAISAFGQEMLQRGQVERNTLLGSIGTGDMKVALNWIVEQHERAAQSSRPELSPVLINTSPTIDPWEGRHVTDGKTCRTCGGIPLEDCQVINKKSSKPAWPSEDECLTEMLSAKNNASWQNGFMYACEWLKNKMMGGV